jgi:murein L,D-transpeptidase YcbB/YkuD
MFAPLLTAQADEPEIVPTDSSATTGAQPTSLSQPLEQSPATAIMAGIKPLPEGIDANRSASSCSRAAVRLHACLYQSAHAALCRPRYETDVGKSRCGAAFQQQLAEVAIAGFQPQFTWVELLTDPAVTGRRGMWCFPMP